MNRKQRRAETKQSGAGPQPASAGANTAFAEASRRHQAGQFSEAEQLYRNVLTLDPRHVDALHMLGVLAGQTGRNELAIEWIKKAITLKPGFADAHFNLGLTLRRMGRTEEAIACLREALKHNPNDADTHNNLGVALASLDRFEEAAGAYDRAVTLRPGFAAAHFNRANALRDLGRTEEALACYQRAVQANPRFADAYLNRAALNYALDRPDASAADFQSALSLKPDAEFAPGFIRYLKSRLCDWSNFANETKAILDGLHQGRTVAQPGQTVPFARDHADMLRAAQVMVAAKIPDAHLGPRPTVPRRLPRTGEKIRLGYFSADLHAHATAHLAAELFERHNRDRFELVAFSFGPQSDDPMRRRLAAAFDRFEEVGSRTDDEIAALARTLEVDIAIDLKGFTQDARYGVFARRAAPIQVNFLGYPGTMGAAFMDYIVADPVVIPPDARGFYAEKVVWLPHSYQPNDSRRSMGPLPARTDFGLPEQAFVFASFNNIYKLTPQMFDIWSRILNSTPGSVLWMLCGHPQARQNLRREAAARGLDPDRLVFADTLPQEQHLARVGLADLFLDTLPCNAHTTASDALWAGLPVLTSPGKTFAGRVAASLLRAIDLPELIADGLEDYATRAIELALNPQKTAALKRKLADHRDTTPLFDAAGYTGHLEAAYQAMFERLQAGQPPDHIRVEA